jgi:hypothetical protein
VPAAKSLDLAEGQIKAGETITGPCGMRPDNSLDGHLLVALTELKGTSAKLEVCLEWSADGVHFVSADPPDRMVLLEAGGSVKHFTFRAPFFRVRENLSGTRASATRAIYVQYN